MKKDNDIDFIGIGAEKAGTTWVADIFRSHPQIFLPQQKEIHYFNRYFVEDPCIYNYNYDKSFSWYKNFFKYACDHHVKGEICPAYLWDDEAPKRIYENFPNIKIFAILRNPIERTYSQYLYYKQKGVIKNEDFETAIKEYSFFLERSKYYTQLCNYYKLFPHKNIKIMFFDDLKKDRNTFIKDLLSFLEVNTNIDYSIIESSNVTGVPKFKKFNIGLASTKKFIRNYELTFILEMSRKLKISQLLEKIRSTTTKESFKKEGIELNTKKHLLNCFLDDIENIEKMLGVDLSTWKQ